MAESPIRTARTALWHFRNGGIDAVSKWRKRRSIQQATAAVSEKVTAGRLADQVLTELFPALPLPQRRPVFADVRVGVILDEFSAMSFGFEWTAVPLTRTGWREELESVDFVFVESAWNGNSGDWKYQLTSTRGPSAEVVELLSDCRSRGIRTVFWNKEDPPHFDDFLPVARLCDVVFTSDERLLPDYRRELGHANVAVLPFAAQPAIHSPARPAKGAAARDIAFAGMYFAHKYPERREQMDLLLGAAEAVSGRMEHGLEIFSRFLGDDARYQFPDSLADRVVGSLPYSHLLTAYKHYKVFLNVNSVVDSPSMCARRIFEITAAGTSVVTTPSAATSEFFPTDEVAQPETREDAEWTLRALVRSKELRDRMVHKAQRRIWQQHTYSHRAMTVMDALDIEYAPPFPTSVSAVVSTNRPDHLGGILSTHARQVHPDRELVLVAHGFDVPADLEARAKDAGVENLTVVTVDAEQPLGECLNRGIAIASGEVIAKMDDDDIYGDQYLSDQLAAMRYSNADLVGKQAHYLHLQAHDVVICRFPEREHRYTDLVMGPTLMARKETLEEFPFAARTLGEDTELQQRLVTSGARIYSADRFNFVQVRAGHSHTWSVDDHLLLANGDVHSFGFAPSHYCF
ncbi:spore maturation protein CgeB [Brevibacterium sanguinis]|uniref:Spore maturation protein CgeB n=2 Tax=Brevibacterium TaxID=1696 RepID=A0A366IEW7_9MICO|nr:MULTISPECIES: glycosyltransferase [Brevibacterium]RBP62931.1 spore maturation protein CgeB [Brevibacterium sanguinis]RBP69524.1 spore maturation protein CgeB [Brevibacterium celere]